MAPYSGYVLIAVALLFAQAICDLTLPDYMSDIVNTGVMDSNIPYIWRMGGKMVLISLISAGASILVGYIAAYVAANVAGDLEAACLKKWSPSQTPSLTTSRRPP